MSCKMRRNPVFIVALSLAVGLGCLLAANPVLHSAPQPAANSSTTELNADVITYNAKSGIMTARGGVRMTQGNTLLTGDAGDYDTKNKTAVVSGNVKIVKAGSTLTAAEVNAYDDMKRFVATGNVVLTDPSGTAAGPRLEYLPEQQYAKITGGARLTNKEAVITASVAEAFFQQDKATADGNVVIVSESRKLEAVADHLVYFGDKDKKGRAELTGNVRAVQDGTILTGNHVILYMDDNALDATGRPQLILKPKQKAETR